MVETSGMAELERNYPVTSGLTAGSTKQEGRQSNLIAEKGSFVTRKQKVGFD